MHYGIEVVTLGDYADPKNVLRLALAAEEAGWEGLFVWDHLGFAWGAPSGDPWVILSATAACTKRLKLVSSVTPLPRRRIQILAQTLVSLDLLSEGRLIFGAGLGGAPEEFTAFGEPSDTRERAEMLDEGLNLLDLLLRGEQVTHDGTHFHLDHVKLVPLPVQKPRIPVWIGGESPPALRRASRWDGWIIASLGMEGEVVKTPDQLASQIRVIREHRLSPAPFDVAITGYTNPTENRLVLEYADAGVTWWVESLNGMRGSPEEMLLRVKAGPPK
jgi:alkanesulfonate monooxygenase SsuD/methylene tetrahydromethanopterin reductase-like flavin-dependent oxidoreductase (luciferase family)